MPATLTPDQMREVTALNAVECELIDEAIGRVLAAIAGRGWDDDVDIVFTTDHGELGGDFGLLFKGPYHVDGLMRLPLIWRPAPSTGATPSSGQSSPVGHVDLAPTFCAIAGLPVPDWMEGKPLPVDDADADARGFERVLTEWDSELFGVGVHLRTITRDGWVCTTYLPGTSHDGTEGELYDLADDPLQRVNRWDDPALRVDAERPRGRPVGSPASDEVTAACRARTGLTFPARATTAVPSRRVTSTNHTDEPTEPTELTRRHADWTRFVPLVDQLRAYQRGWFANDALAGTVLVALLVPAGMAYAQASGLPPITGLYATIIPLLVYALVGPSRVLVMGPDSSLAPLILAAIVPLAASDPSEAVALAGTLSVVVGVIGVLAGLARFGFLAELLSAPVRYGYLNGIALTIVVNQLPKAFGFSVDADGMIDTARAFARGVADGDSNGWAVGIAAGSLAVIVLIGRWTKVVPGVLVAVVGSILVTIVFSLAGNGISLVGDLPSGFPRPSLPDTDWDNLAAMFGAALGISFVAFADTSVLARVFALKRGAKVDSNQELVALGLVNITSGFFQGFPVSGSSSRTPVAEAAGARTQLTGVFAALVLLVLLLVGSATFRNLPQATLAAVVIAAAMRMFAIGPVVRLARLRRSEFVLSMAAFAAVALFGAITGVVIAIALSLLNFMRKAWKPHTTELVRVDGLKGYHDNIRHPEGRHIPGLMLYRFDAPLFFANARFFVEDVLERVDHAGRDIEVVVVTAEPITDVDTTAADAIEELIRDLEARHVTLRFSELKGHVRERLEVYGLIDLIGSQHITRTTGESVHAWVRESGTEWVDWEDRARASGDEEKP